MPSKNMLPKGKRRQSVRSAYRAQRPPEQARRIEVWSDTGERVAADEPDAAVPAGGTAHDTAGTASTPAASAGGPVKGRRGKSARGGTAANASKAALGNTKQLQAGVAPGAAADEAPSASTAPPMPVWSEEAPGQRHVTVDPGASGLRLDQYLARALSEISRGRVQLLVEHGQVTVDGKTAKPSLKLRGGEHIVVTGSPEPEPLRATPEDIPLSIVFEDKYLAVVDKAAGMMVHAGAGVAPEGADADAPDPRTSGTLVNALLHRFRNLSESGGPLRPGIVHRLDKQTSGLILVAKDDETHRRLAEMFHNRTIEKHYTALVHGHLKQDDTTVDLAIGRDPVRRNRMTARRLGDDHDYWSVSGPGEFTEEDEEYAQAFEQRLAKQRAQRNAARHALSHVHVIERLDTPFGPFTLADVHIETGRTHQIRVHLQALGHPVVGDTLYGAPAKLSTQPLSKGAEKVAAKKATAASAKSVASLKAATTASKVSGPASKVKANDAAASTLPELALGRNFLHAALLRLKHPRLKSKLELSAPLPPELQSLLDALRLT
jgi:23S rRNA pseudouridine1911/1915/1917 synthase